MRRLAFAFVAAQVAVVSSAAAYAATRPTATDAAGQRLCHAILATPFQPVVEGSAQAEQLRRDAMRIESSRRWDKVVTDLQPVLQALGPADRTLVAWDGPSPRMIQNCHDAL
jgi:hypothetical protein